MTNLADDNYVPRAAFDELLAKWNDVEAVRKRACDLHIQTPETEERLLNYIDLDSTLKGMSPKQLVDVALEHLSTYVEDIHYELVIEELCLRVYPNWIDEEN